VVFPAPLGPISPVIRPSGKSHDTSLTATWPPKRRVTPTSESGAAAIA
jgi:hypothetical protein